MDVYWTCPNPLAEVIPNWIPDSSPIYEPPITQSPVARCTPVRMYCVYMFCVARILNDIRHVKLLVVASGNKRPVTLASVVWLLAIANVTSLWISPVFGVTLIDPRMSGPLIWTVPVVPVVSPASGDFITRTEPDVWVPVLNLILFADVFMYVFAPSIVAYRALLFVALSAARNDVLAPVVLRRPI